MKRILLISLLLIVYLQLWSQSACTITGKVSDIETGMPINGAAVSVFDTNIGTFTDSVGYFSFCHLEAKQYILKVEYIGYGDARIVADPNSGIIDIRLSPTSVELKDVIISITTHRNNLLDKPAANFAQILNAIPGITTANIGAGISKPIIRGLGFNRVNVINRGITQQDQQWGADHGLGINQFDMYSAMVYKGANALLLGSSGTATIDVEPYKFRKNDFFSGEAVLRGASNNDQLGAAFSSEWQKGKWYMRGSFNYQDFADYRVPASKVDYDGEGIALTDKRVPNTAGKEHSFAGTVGLKERSITSYLNVSNNYQKNGLFELVDDHDHDRDADITDTSHRNIGMPYATSNHFTLSNNTQWTNSSVRLLVNTGYQLNHRKEFEHFHEHYEGQPQPSTDDDLAVDFKLHTYSSNARLYLNESEKWRKTIGASVEYMQNRIGGFEYFLPRYNQVSGGVSFINNLELSDILNLDAGIRYDIAHTDITGFYDNSLAAHLEEEGYDAAVVKEYAQRGYNVNKNFGSWSGSIGTKYRAGRDMMLKTSISKSFRFPSANELAANGIHHAAFRYEIGNPNLKAEQGYTFDFVFNYWKNNSYPHLEIEINPFVSYYSNFIYLQTEKKTTVDLYETQPYRYSQAKAIYGGGEYGIKYWLLSGWEISSAGSIVLNKNLDDHEPLPFTPPFTMRNELKYSKTKPGGKISYYQLSVSHTLYTKQSRVGIAEEKTPGTNLFNAGGGFDYNFSNKCKLMFNVQVQNIFNTCYLNHLSLYRRLNIPEPGRNVQVFIRLPFTC